MNEAHERGLMVPDKKRNSGDSEMAAAGAYVAVPKKGIHEWVGAVDINSLYPSAIRTLNMAPETIVAQVRQTLTEQYLTEKARNLASEKRNYDADDDLEMSSLLWEGLFGTLEYEAIMKQERGTMLTVDFESGESVEMSAAEVWKLIYDSNKPYILSANGTIFRSDSEGVIPGLLTRWYSDRKDMQKKLKESKTKEDIEYWDKRQLVRKILLNSAYGALLNEHCRFYDKRIGQSVTLCGRQIVKHMSAQINEIVTGKYDFYGDAIVYGDTDSCYFTAWPILNSQIQNGEMEWNKELCVQLYDNIAEQANESFPSFMERAFHVPRRMCVIKAGRELIGDRSLFITKKRYAVNIFDKEGKRLDKDGKLGKIKAMGLDLKRADTPRYVQDFLFEVLEMVLHGKTREDVIERIKQFKIELGKQDSWTKGSPKSVNKLTMYGDLEANSKTGKANMPGHVRAALNWNYLRKANSDNYSMKMIDGMKVIVCKLKPNPIGFTSIAYPTDELRLPTWFTELPFDDSAMEATLVDKKIENLLGVLDWDLRDNTDTNSTFDDLFSFG
jgi:DNA polymerase elongation subunit (family B)